MMHGTKIANAPMLDCPYCGLTIHWAFGIVVHREYVHIRIRNRPSECKTVQEMASIIARSPQSQMQMRRNGR